MKKPKIGELWMVKYEGEGCTAIVQILGEQLMQYDVFPQDFTDKLNTIDRKIKKYYERQDFLFNNQYPLFRLLKSKAIFLKRVE